MKRFEMTTGQLPPTLKRYMKQYNLKGRIGDRFGLMIDGRAFLMVAKSRRNWYCVKWDEEDKIDLMKRFNMFVLGQGQVIIDDTPWKLQGAVSRELIMAEALNHMNI